MLGSKNCIHSKVNTTDIYYLGSKLALNNGQQAAIIYSS